MLGFISFLCGSSSFHFEFWSAPGHFGFSLDFSVNSHSLGDLIQSHGFKYNLYNLFQFVCPVWTAHLNSRLQTLSLFLTFPSGCQSDILNLTLLKAKLQACSSPTKFIPSTVFSISVMKTLYFPLLWLKASVSTLITTPPHNPRLFFTLYPIQQQTVFILISNYILILKTAQYL